MNGGRNRGNRHHFLKLLRREVGKANCPHLAFRHRLFHSLIAADVVAHRLVEQEKVDIFQIQPFQRRVDTLHIIILRPELGSDKDFLAGDGALDTPTHALLVAVGAGGIRQSPSAGQGLNPRIPPSVR